MSDERVGREIPAAARWKERGDGYARGIEGPYHRHRLDVIGALLPDLAGAEVVDVGCGEGVLIREARSRGAGRVTGIDIDDGLLERARDSGADHLILGGVEQMASIERADCVIAANVVAYFTDDEYARFCAEVTRLLAPGGTLVITHSNELFDMFTLNAFTVAFFRERFGCDPTALLSRPDEPRRTGFNVRENPLSYVHRLAAHGLRQEQIEFIHRHAAPPLLSPGEDWDDIDSRDYPDTLAVPDDERWMLMFQCSMFGVRAVRI